jgi:nucleotide-binding universal stress UspA family protein
MANAAAKRYLQGFNVPDVETAEQTDAPESVAACLTTAHTAGVDMIVCGDEPHGILANVFGEDPAEAVAERSSLPLLVAR